MQKMPIELKGSNFTFLVLYLNTNNVDLISKSLYKKIQEYPQFFKNVPVIVNVSNLLNQVNWKKIQEIIIEYGFYIVGVSGCKDNYFKKIIVESGLPVLLESNTTNTNKDLRSFYHTSTLKKTKNEQRLRVKKIEKTHIINTPVRSGQKIYAKYSDLVVINNVSAGAELVADGNIHVYGSVRGRVLAGANGDITSKIFCTTLFAELISVSGQYWLSDQIPSHFIGKSAQIYLKNKFLTINSLS
ncbi:septum site-determining protein MinC [Buchnera aphidicola]|jgi:septum site-determining protein MinC|uniref:Probable septum site-determining protein MinC n=1 Tax=Buchnera aphidicola subsp. Schizaphis graminum (strain Sg) TaxID=198804 RepID=MINC_BUCAP|nr:septum site-determining protein MinC [Buchnera aphidicola]Q8K9L6.1 RecName: Full=Probable septum site-determining protein MinC [Buchnera aphidicola str. Sg (Schizaphis graminum)]AAM67872.1 cell division inhibitor MinC [Buchnera aphidicola str. Sg (Schizaphis graminum)]AWI49633.1 septum site-determining protein MinC [Buchnera aphidicola (Schizaphis graminum)]